MALKPRIRRRILLGCAIAAAILALAVVIVPTMVNLNGLKPRIEQAIATQTGVDVKIRGDVHFSLLGRTTIVAHDIMLPGGEISAAMFAVPLTKIFDLENATLAGEIVIYGGKIQIDKLTPVPLGADMSIYDVAVTMRGRQFYIIDARAKDGVMTAAVRVDGHKYVIEFNGDTFAIYNANNRFMVRGRLFADGSARGTVSIETSDINSLLDFESPRIDHTVKLQADFEWDGGRGVKLTSITSDTFRGSIELRPDGSKTVRIISDNMDQDFSFLLSPTQIFRNTNLDLKLAGRLRMGGKELSSLAINAISTTNEMQIASIVADDTAITGGRVTRDGIYDMMIATNVDGDLATCLFSGNANRWQCNPFSYGDMTGTIFVDDGTFNISVKSDKPMGDSDILNNIAKKIGKRGKITFEFSNIGGVMDIDDTATDGTTQLSFGRDKTLADAMADAQFLPDFIRNARGNFDNADGNMQFRPYDGDWELSAHGSDFTLRGRDFKKFLPGMDLRALHDWDYVASGTYRGDNISNLTIQIAGHEFTGAMVGNTITLHTDFLDIDAFVSQSFTDNYAELEFLMMPPIMLPFDIGLNVSLSAGRLIYNGQEYTNFTYSLKSGIQTFSITDQSRGDVFATLKKNGGKYDIFAQLRRFEYAGPIPGGDASISLRDTTVTGEIQMTTSGNIAHDITYNLAGDIDLTFDGGTISGIGIDEFYARATDIDVLNAEHALAAALDGGASQIKQLHIRGQYENGDFETTTPFELQMRHTDVRGTMGVRGGKTWANMELTLRGTSPAPEPIELRIDADGNRQYGLTRIMDDFDPSFMREFIKTHNQF